MCYDIDLLFYFSPLHYHVVLFCSLDKWFSNLSIFSLVKEASSIFLVSVLIIFLFLGIKAAASDLITLLSLPL